MLIAAVFTIAKKWKKMPKCPSINERITYIDTIESYSVIKAMKSSHLT
jgi:hypothetical protein